MFFKFRANERRIIKFTWMLCRVQPMFFKFRANESRIIKFYLNVLPSAAEILRRRQKPAEKLKGYVLIKERKVFVKPWAEEASLLCHGEKYRASKSRVKFTWTMPSAADIHKIKLLQRRNEHMKCSEITTESFLRNNSRWILTEYSGNFCSSFRSTFRCFPFFLNV